MKFKLICEYDEGEIITHEFQKVFLPDVLVRMHDFLKGCGFVFDGQLDIINEDYEPPTNYTYETFEKPTKEELRDDLDGRC